MTNPGYSQVQVLSHLPPLAIDWLIKFTSAVARYFSVAATYRVCEIHHAVGIMRRTPTVNRLHEETFRHDKYSEHNKNRRCISAVELVRR